MTNYSFDHITNTLTVTAAFLKKAGILNSPEYKTIMEFKANHEGLKIEKADAAKKTGKHHIKLVQMVKYIQFLDRLNGTNVYAQYLTVKELSRIQRSPYKYVEDWFLRTFPNFETVVSFDEKGQMIFKSEDDQKSAENKPALTVVGTDEKLEASA